MPGRIVSLFRNLLRRNAVEQALDDELQSSVELLTKERIEGGLSRSEARRRALVELGGVEQLRTKVREIRVGRILEDFATDLHFALRTLAKSPGYATAIIASLALGIAANATVFSVANGLLWGMLPIKDPERMVMLSEGKSFSYPDYVDYRDQTANVFEGGVTAHFPLVPASLGGAGTPERVWGEVVSGNYFSVLGVNMTVGHPIEPDDDRVERGGRVVVLSQSLWQRHFGADAGILGRDVILNGQHYAVIGVAPAGFHGSERGLMSDFWVPLSMVDEIIPGLTGPGGGRTKRDNQWLVLDARLMPGIRHAQAATAVNLVKKRLDDIYRKDQKQHEAITLQNAGGLPGVSVTPVFALMTILMIVAALVLMVACANVANLLLGRATGRQREMGVRLAMGAVRGRLIRQLLTESLLLALAGAGVGFLLATVAARAISSFRLPVPLPLVFDFNVDLRVVEFTAGLSLVTTLLFGLAPALRATRTDVAVALKEGQAGLGSTGRSKMRSALVVVQVALSLVLLTVAGLFLRSLQKAASIDVGFEPDNILVMRVDPLLQNYPSEKTMQFLSGLRGRVLALPGVRSMSFVDLVPLSLANNGRDFSVEAASGYAAQSINADIRGVFSGYFQTMGIPFMSGRDFDSNANRQSAAIILNQTMASHLFPNQDPIGRMVHAGKASYTVIGVVRNSKSRTVGEGPRNCAYLFLDLTPGKRLNFFGISALIKTAVDPRQMERPVREQIAALDPNLAVFNTETMQEQFSQALLLPRMSAWLLGCFGAVGLTLGAIGLYGVMSYSVRRRTHEIGVRMAMGARRGAVVAMVLRQGLTLTSIGVAIGLALAMVVGHLSAGMLYGIRGTDLITFLVVPTVLVFVALAAILVPARRAAQVDPAVALRNE
jgi:predicted permease